MDSLTNKSISVGTSAVKLADDLAPTQRKFISIINTSTGGQVISISINADPANGQGIVLSPGGSYTDSQDGAGYFPPSFNIQAISDLAGGKVAILERVGKPWAQQ